ncbi:MAG TPA: glycosyltransferase family 4 protein [Anaerolineaceae bacterium]|nr:glycosyltransferase family 4 protein [Anaerolineaceae bacterium]
MRILVVLTYYRPHTSGLTIYAERLAKALVRRGHQVTVLTSQYDKTLALEEECEGVKVMRVPVSFRISKGVIMPKFGLTATRLVKQHDVIQLHLPQFDAAGVALRGRLSKKPTVITYHCDLLLPHGVISWAANQAVKLMNTLAATFTHRIVTYTQDYAENSSYLRRYMDKLQTILPPVELPVASPEEIRQFAFQHNPLGKKPVIGMAARFATEKGVEILLDAIPKVLEKQPDAQVWFAGPYQNILGEEEYAARLMPRIHEYEKAGTWHFMDTLDPAAMAAYYPNLDVHVLPSLNSTEAFGLVQIEAMMNGVPCVASNLPGVRRPVQMHQMGEVVPIGDSAALGEAINKILADPAQYRQDPREIASHYIPDQVAREYEQIFENLLKDLHNGRK